MWKSVFSLQDDDDHFGRGYGSDYSVIKKRWHDGATVGGKVAMESHPAISEGFPLLLAG